MSTDIIPLLWLWIGALTTGDIITEQEKVSKQLAWRKVALSARPKSISNTDKHSVDIAF